MSVLKKIIQRWSKEKLKLEELIPGQIKNIYQFERAWAKYKYRPMHTERESLGIIIFRGFTTGQDRHRYGTSVCEMFGVNIHTRG